MLVKSPGFTTLAVLSLLFIPELLPSLNELWRRPAKLPLRLQQTAEALKVAINAPLAKTGKRSR